MTAAIPMRLKQGTPAWLEARRATIGSSDIPIIVGESTYKSAYTLAAEKLGLIPEYEDDDTREQRAIGKLMQPVLIAIHRMKSGLPTRDAHRWLRHPQIEWATASLDANAGRRAVEAKWLWATKWREGDPVPGDIKAQVQWQLFVTGWDVADVVAIVGHLPRLETIERNDSFIDDLLYFAREFHERTLLGELPPVDGTESTARTLKTRHPSDNGIWIEATPELAALCERLADARARKREGDADDKALSNVIRDIVGGATGIVGLASLKANRDSARTNWPSVAEAYRKLLEGVATPDQLNSIESIHTETTEGARPIRLLSKGATE